MQCATQDPVHAISKKCQIDLSHIAQAYCIHASDLSIMINNEVIHDFPEGQDMVVEFFELLKE